ncbi:hypothetical protein [Streptomyces manipurensis]|uniref:hypothetical protein n=1 Tax=Streptomyces manipurensis TaxID=1077945 RepID=UPI003C6EF748
MAWLRTNRRLRSEVAYLREELAKAREQEQAPLVVTTGPRPGPRPGPVPSPVAPAAPVRTAEEERLRAEVRALRELRTLPGAAELARDRRVWQERAEALDERLHTAQRTAESLDWDLRMTTLRAVAAEKELERTGRTAELQVGPS